MLSLISFCNSFCRDSKNGRVSFAYCGFFSPVIKRGVFSIVAFVILATMPISCQSASATVSMQAMDLNGKPHSLPVTGSQATVLFFVIHDCPICNRYAPEINRIVSDYSSRHVAFFLVYVESDFSAAQARQHAKEYGFQCGLLRDPNHSLSHATGATVASEAVLLAPDGTVAYRGRIDNSYSHFSTTRSQPTSRDLRDALDALLSGRPITSREMATFGCAIPDN